MAHKVSTIVLKVDLECSRCYNKIRKTLCRYRERYQIVEEIFDEKQNTVTISGPFCPRKLAKKLCCKAGNAIKCIKIVEKKPPPPPPPAEPEPPPPPPPVLEAPPPPPRRRPTRPPSPPSPRPTPVVVVEVVVEVPPPQSNSAPPRRSLKSAPPAPYEEYGEGPCDQSYGGAPEPWYDGCGRSPPQWYSGYGSPSYFSEEDPNSCIIM